MFNFKLVSFILITMFLVSFACSTSEETSKENKTMDQHVEQSSPEYLPPKGDLDSTKTYTATIKTDLGDIVIELYADIASVYVENFVNLAKSGFYDGSSFHRVIPGFMAQGGTRNGEGPGYQFNDFFHPDMKHDSPGVISMANAGLNTNSSQFFITYSETQFLDPFDENGNPKECGTPGVSCHAVFGRVIQGMETVENITPIQPGEPITPTSILTVDISESR